MGYFLQPPKDNMRMFIIILNSLILLLYGCKEVEFENYSVTNSNEDISPIPLVWQIPLAEDTREKNWCLTMECYLVLRIWLNLIPYF